MRAFRGEGVPSKRVNDDVERKIAKQTSTAEKEKTEHEEAETYKKKSVGSKRL